MEPLSSTKNPKIKQLLALQQKSSERRAAGLFVVEGKRELQHCLKAGYQIDTVFWCPAIATGKESMADGGSSEELSALDHARHIYEVTPEVYNHIAYRGGTEGIIAEVKTRTAGLDTIRCDHDGLFIVLEGVEKPGNLGAILRSADAAGVDGVIICDPRTDLYNPNLIRSSIGAVFTVPCFTCSSEECISFLKTNGIQILTAQLQDSELYYDTDMTKPTAIVMGTESVGLSDIWRKAADAHIRIPMLGQLDSLNVSVSTAILMFEAVRQRKSQC